MLCTLMSTLLRITLSSIIFVVIAVSPFSVTALAVSTSTNTSVNSRVEVHTNGTSTTVSNSRPLPTQTTTPTKIPTISSTLPTAIPSTAPVTASAVSPTPRPRATATVRPTASPTQVTSASDEKRTFIMNAINEYRRSKGLYAVKTSTETCNFAKVRAREISVTFNHDGFRNRINSKTIPYARWTSITENIAMTGNYKNVATMWISSSGHAANMRKDTPYVCVESYGNYYAYEGMRP